MAKPTTIQKKSSSSSSKSILTPLQKTKSALKEIDRALHPHLRLLKRLRCKHNKGGDIYADYDDPRRMQQLAEAQTAVSLAIGTLNYIGNRLKGSDEGKKKGGPLRTELDRMRAMLVTLRKLQSSADAANAGESIKKTENEKSAEKSDVVNSTERSSENSESSPKGKREAGKLKLDIGAAKRMVNAALASDIVSNNGDKNSGNSSLSRIVSNPEKSKRRKTDSDGSTRKKRKSVRGC
mmetsp:Transcript_31845/g.46422  ORF Transcript_31845/g.46422 Transcript_31845/m.46422 type:complete len:237 (-) Transcript_31845:364-1074(-)